MTRRTHLLGHRNREFRIPLTFAASLHESPDRRHPSMGTAAHLAAIPELFGGLDPPLPPAGAPERNGTCQQAKFEHRLPEGASTSSPNS